MFYQWSIAMTAPSQIRVEKTLISRLNALECRNVTLVQLFSEVGHDIDISKCMHGLLGNYGLTFYGSLPGSYSAKVLLQQRRPLVRWRAHSAFKVVCVYVVWAQRLMNMIRV